MFFKKNKKDFKNFYKDFFSSFQEGELLFSSIEFFPDGILLLDEKQKISLVNPKAENILQIKGVDILGKSPLELGQLESFKNLIPLLGEKKEDPFEKDLQIKKGFFLSVSIIPIFSEKGFKGTIVVLKDVSKDKLLEKAKTDFVTLAAHQFRTPASAIKWSLSTLLTQETPPEEQKELIEKAYKTNDKMISLINNLLDFAKIEKGEQFYQPSLIQIEEFILDIIKNYKERIEKKELNLSFVKPEDPLSKVMIDPIKMKMAIENILDNAIRYTLKKGEIEIYFEQKEEKISIFFKDNGLGIPQNQQNKVFSYFFRGSNILQTHTEGVGLGLYFAKNIIEAHEGKIWFKSTEGKGSLFAFSLPVKKKFNEFITKDFY